MAVIKEKRQFRTTPIGVISSDRGTDRLYNSISAAADNVLGMAYKEGVRLAEKRGIETAQSMDEIKIRAIDPTTGKPEAMTFAPKSFGTVARDAYDRVINDRFRSSIENDIKIKGAEFSLKYENDPKSVEKYSLAMSEYVSEMSKNASGIYKPFIEETGKFYLASTKLKLTEKRMNIQRAQTAAYTTERIDTLGQQAYDMAASGADPEDVLKMIRKGADLAKDAEGANLFQAGSSNGVEDSLMAQAAQGTLANVLARPMTTRTRDAITLAITNGGKTIDRIPDQFKLDVAEIISLTNLNNRNDVLAFANASIADYNASDAYDIAEAARLAAQQTNVGINQFGSSISDTLDFARRSGSPAAFEGALVNAANRFQEQLSNIQNDFNNLDPTQQSSALLNSQNKNLREQTIRSVLLEAAKDGNVGQLQTAIITGRTDITGLSENQQAAVAMLHSNPSMYQNIEDASFASGILSGSQDDVAKRIEDNQFVVDLNKNVSSMNESIANGSADPEEALALYNSIVSTELLTPNMILDLQRSMRVAQGIGIANTDLSGMSSAAINAVSLYVDSNGKNDLGLGPTTKAVADKILSGIQYETDVTSVVQHINTIENRVSQFENDMAAQTKAANLMAKVAAGGSNSVDKASREAADVLIANMGVDLNDPASVTNPNVYAIARNTLPESMVTNLKNFATGAVSMAGSDVLMQHYFNLSNDVDPQTGVVVNRFAQTGGLGDDDIAFLETVSLIAANYEGAGTVAEIAQKLRTADRDATVKANLNSMFDGNYTKWTNEYVGDVYAATKIAPLVKYMAISGFGQDAIKEQVDNQLEKVFVKSDGYVRDPRFPAENYTRSEYSLTRTIADPEARQEFVNVINRQLPNGYILQTTQQRNRTLSATDFQVENAQAISLMDQAKKQVVLVPDEMSGTGNVTYYAYIVNENNELKPLIYNSKTDGSGRAIFPAFDLSELDGFYRQKQLDVNANFKIQAQQQKIDAISPVTQFSPRGRPSYRNIQQ